MKFFLLIMARRVLRLLSVALAAAAPVVAQSTFYNGGQFTVDRPIDAVTFVNAGDFLVSSSDPFSTRNTLVYTNFGTISAAPGFEMLRVDSRGFRTPSTVIFNSQGALIRGFGSTAFDGFFGIPQGQDYNFGDGGFLTLNATNIINRGSISVSYWGDLSAAGRTVDLRRSSFIALSREFDEPTRRAYLDPPQIHITLNPHGVRSLNWGFWVTPVQLDSFATPVIETQTFVTALGPVAVTRTNAAIDVSYFSSTGLPPSDPNTSLVNWNGYQILSQGNPNAMVYIQTNQLTRTNNRVNAVFIINHNANVVASATVDGLRPLSVRFGYTVTNNADASVDFRTFEISERFTLNAPTNAPYARDYNYASAMVPWYVTLNNGASVRIPITTTDRPFLADELSPRNVLSRSNLMERLGESRSGANSWFDPRLFTDGFFDLTRTWSPYTNVVSTNDYMAYTFDLTTLPSRLPSPTNAAVNFSGGFGGSSFSFFPMPEISFLTNIAGRVRVDADNLALEDARLRASGIVRLSARHVTTSRNTSVAAPYAWYDLGSTNGTLTYQGLSPIAQPSLNGVVQVLVMSFTNSVDLVDPAATDTNTVTAIPALTQFRVMIVDADFRPFPTSGQLGYLKLRATNLTTADSVAYTIPNPNLVNTVFPSVDPAAVAAQGAEQIAPITENWVNTSDFSVAGTIGISYRTFPRLRTLANSGSISAEQISLGTETGRSLSWFNNSGVLSSSGLLSLSAVSVTNAGPIFANNVLGLDGGTVVLGGPNVLVYTGGQLNITAGSLNAAAGGLISAGGLVNIDVTNSFVTPVGSTLTISGLGVRLARNATANNLLGVNVDVTADRFGTGVIEWPGADLGAGAAGYVNNSAIGALTLDSDEFGQIQIASSTGSAGALYVQRLELGPAFEDFINVAAGRIDFEGLSSLLDIATNMRLYYNVVTVNGVELKGTLLDGAFDGRLRLVNSAGATGGGVTMDLGGGFSVTAPWAVRYSATLDSDGDGLVNAADNTPFSGAVVSTQVMQLNGRPYFEIAWNAAARTSYRIMVNEPSAGGGWSLLSTMSNETGSAKTLKFYDPMDRGSGAKTYRVVYMP